jgi:fluoroacetyl-CoA thioesterase
MSIEQLKPGLRHTQTLRVDAGLTVPAVSPAFTGFTDMPPVFATAFLVGFVEWTCVEALRPCLPAGARTVGVHVDLSHIAATPVGMQVSADVELIAVQGRQLRFRVRCRDDADLICEGHHDRALVDFERFMARMQSKRDALR